MKSSRSTVAAGRLADRRHELGNVSWVATRQARIVEPTARHGAFQHTGRLDHLLDRIADPV